MGHGMCLRRWFFRSKQHVKVGGVLYGSHLHPISAQDLVGYEPDEHDEAHCCEQDGLGCFIEITYHPCSNSATWECPPAPGRPAYHHHPQSPHRRLLSRFWPTTAALPAWGACCRRQMGHRHRACVLRPPACVAHSPPAAQTSSASLAVQGAHGTAGARRLLQHWPATKLEWVCT